MSKLYRGPPIDDSYQVSVHLTEVSVEKIKMWKVNGRRTPSDGKSSHCLWQGELKSNHNLWTTNNTYTVMTANQAHTQIYR